MPLALRDCLCNFASQNREFLKEKPSALFVSAYKRILGGEKQEGHPNVSIKIGLSGTPLPWESQRQREARFSPTRRTSRAPQNRGDFPPLTPDTPSSPSAPTLIERSLSPRSAADQRNLLVASRSLLACLCCSWRRSTARHLCCRWRRSKPPPPDDANQSSSQIQAPCHVRVDAAASC